jgi:hypothetical protein
MNPHNILIGAQMCGVLDTKICGVPKSGFVDELDTGSR